jgi:hypothetical protein
MKKFGPALFLAFAVIHLACLRATAATIDCGQTVTGTIVSPPQKDSYTFTADAGEAVIVTAVATSGTLSAFAQLFDPSGIPIAGNSGNNSTGSIVLRSTGIYTITVSDFIPLDGTGNYELNLQFTTGRCAQSTACGQIRSGRLTGISQHNAYAFSASAGETVVVTAVRTSGTLSAFAQLFDPSGTAIAGNSGNNSTGSIVLRSTGIYTITVSDFIPLDSMGDFDVSLQSIGGCSGPALPISPVPSVSVLSPNEALAGNSALDLTVVGSSFVPGTAVRWNGEDRSTTFLGSTQLRAVISASDLASAGTASVTVFNPAPGGGVSNALSFSVSNPAPSVICLNPISLVAGAPEFSLIVYGSSFVQSSVVRWNGSNRATTYVSSTEIHASIPASDIASEGTAAITVSNPAPGGGVSGSVSLAIITLAPGAPTINSISPDKVPAGGEGFTLTVNGTGFVMNSVVQFNGQDRATTFASSTELTAAITAENIAEGFTYGITVVNPASSGLRLLSVNDRVYATQGTGSNTGVVTVLNPVPVLTGLTPSSAKAGSSTFTVTAEGTKFVSSSTIRWNGADRTTTFTNDTRLGGTILASDVATEGTGTASTSVSSPGPGGGTSNSLTFTIRTKEAAATTLYYPRLVSNTTETTGIAVANLSGTDGVLTLWAFDKAGSEVKAKDITNPVSVTIKGVEQLPILDWQLFGPGLTAKSPVGWVKLESTVPKTVGFFLTFDNTLSTMDGADVSAATLTLFILPEIEDQGTTQIHIANPDPAAADIQLELYKSDGTQRGGGVTRKVNSNGTVAELLTDLFPGVTPNGSDYIRASSNKGVVSFEYLGKEGKYVEGLNGQDANAGATVLYSPQYVAGGGYRTTLSVVNLESIAGTVKLELIGDDGTLLAPAKTAAIPSRGKVYITDEKYFLDPGGSLVQGYVKVTSSGPKLTGSVVFGDPERERFSSSLPLVSNLLTSAVFGQVASNSTYFTGIAILNPNDTDATATVDVYDRNGNLVRTTSQPIGAKRRVSRLVTQYFEDLVGQDIASGYIKVTVDKGVASFALFGTNDLSVLSAIPPQVVP